MKILVVTQYFWPETFRINDLCMGLKHKGHDVHVLTGKPNYPKGKFYEGYNTFSNASEEWNGIKIHRSILIARGDGGGIRLLLNYFSFAFFASLRVLFIKGNFDKIFVYEPSPITVGIPAIFAKMRFKAPIYFWVQDLWPESLLAGGGIENRFVLGFFNGLTKFIYKHSKFILIQSKAFKSYILEQGVEERKILYYPNSTEGFYRVIDEDKNYATTLPIGFKLMFAGNIGEAQSIETLLLASKILKEKNIQVKWIILGEGRMKNTILDKVKVNKLEKEFFFLGSYPVKEMPHFFSCADALIVSLKKDNIFALTIPSKIQSYLACGRPIIGSLDGEGARIISESEAGFSADAEDELGLANAVERFYNLSDYDKHTMGNNARIYYEKEFDRDVLIDKLITILGYE